ncbi:hypothetical protein K435DRAFT_874159, partial [Dendrothele bispora CBS 962.96]
MEEDKAQDNAEPLGDIATIVANTSAPPSLVSSPKSSPDSEIFLSNCETIAVLSLYSTLSSDVPGLDEPLFKVDAPAQYATNLTPHKWNIATTAEGFGANRPISIGVFQTQGSKGADPHC